MMLKSLCTVVLSSIIILSASADINQDVWKLSKEKATLMRQTESLFRKNKIEDKALDALKAKAGQASVAFVKARKAHPDLKALYVTSDAAQNKMIKAMMAKDKEASKVARNEYTDARRALEAESVKIPELVELQKKAIDANKAVDARKAELVATTPEGKVLMDKVKVLDDKIAELQKQLK